MEGHRQKGHDSTEDQGGMGHRQGEIERSLQDVLPRMGHGSERSDIFNRANLLDLSIHPSGQ